MKNSIVTQRTVRAQAYVPLDRMATGQDKARYTTRTKDMRGWWKIIVTRNGFLDSVEAFHSPMKGKPIKAYINNGRWVANCPDPECAGCEVVDYGDPVFMCLSCGNLRNKHGGKIRLYPVSFPRPNEREEIENILLKRKRRVNRNWKSDLETKEDLVKENKEYGLE